MKRTFKQIKQLLVLGSILGFAGLNACEYKVLAPSIDCSTSDLTISVVSVTDANCGLSNGAVELSATGTATPLTFSLSGTRQESGIFEGLAAGSYTASIENAEGCTKEIEVSIANINGVSISDIVMADAGCDGNNGRITITATGGALPYSYSINGGDFQVGNIFSGLSKGPKTVVVKDASNCEFSQNVAITSGISFSTTISPIIQSSCATPGCHNGSRSPNLTSFSNIKSNAGRIKIRTSNRSMPQGSSLSQTQIDAIGCWVDDGAPNN